MLTKTVTYTDEQILRIFLIMQTVCLLPFLITDLALIHNSFSECLLANFGERQKNPFGIFVLGEWVYMDGYIKLAVYTAVIFFNIIAVEISCKRTLVVVCGWILRLFYLFDFGWTVAASVLFWQKNSGLPNPTYTYCEDSPYKGYLFFLLIFTYIIIPINLFVCGFRSNKVSELESTLVSERRGTELVEK